MGQLVQEGTGGSLGASDGPGLASTKPVQAHPPAEPGTAVEVTWGEELFQPIQYNTLRVGPFKGVTLVRAGESVADATYRLWLELNEVAMRIRDEKIRAYLKAGDEVAQSLGGSRR